MAPTFRSSRSGRQFVETANRSRTSAADHDIFEGLPIRRWSRQSHTISQEAKTEIPADNAGTTSSTITGKTDHHHPFPELPMPKDSHLLAPQSRALLRAARAGYIYLLPATKDTQPVDEREGHDMEDATTPAAKMERSYTTRKWSQVPRHVELPEVEFLAKRRPGLPSLYGASGAVTAAVPNASQPMRKAKIRKINPDTGNITIYDAWIPEGQKVEGEIKDESQAANGQQDVTVIKATPAPGTVVEGVGVANAEGIVVASTAVESPAKRKGPPPPKRKGRGLRGRGRKKVMFAPGEGAEVGGEDRPADGEQEEDDEDEEGEEGEDAEDAEDAEETTKHGETPQVDTPVAPATAPKLDPEAMPSLTPQPVAAENNVVSSAVEHLIPQPQSPVRPESEQLTPPAGPGLAIESSNVEEVSEVKPEPTPSADMMEDVQQTQPNPAGTVTERVEVTETVQPAPDEKVAVQSETKVAQTVPSDVPVPSETVEGSGRASITPEIQPNQMNTLVKEPARPTETYHIKTEQSPVVGAPDTEVKTENEPESTDIPTMQHPPIEDTKTATEMTIENKAGES
ncbi:conserved hypothetical protein [Talaromyces stipitatus ATCC 10500]|uniref:LYR family protein n=1 Tax=Talaromyces stipitatus (strain ATCC 10500 / CBS 375.48 / QM 6759 / NRRL 1006) TaxID=441959 RepID=B8MLW3_TALSN|nr:uncharacterized protein TSTA_101290 [Talaromyces stipitatus ATCC 10500]EED13889.1 conserved hypothetical protein [Talaromyces stipitatus ATCC 10500]